MMWNKIYLLLEPKFYVRLLCVDADLAAVQWGSTENKNLVLENNLAEHTYDTEWINEINLTLTDQNETIKEDSVRKKIFKFSFS